MCTFVPAFIPKHFLVGSNIPTVPWQKSSLSDVSAAIDLNMTSILPLRGFGEVEGRGWQLDHHRGRQHLGQQALDISPVF